MASGTGKSKRKTKGKTIDLQSFLQEDNPSTPEGFTKLPNISWTSLMDEDIAEDPFQSTGNKPQVILPTAPKAARPPNIDLSRIPSDAPFKAHLANLPYDINEDDIIRFFVQLDIKDVQLPRDGGRLKGFGYAEFHDRDTLIEALNFNNETLKNRTIAVSLPSSDGGSNEERRPFRSRDDRRDRDEPREDRTDENWRSANQRPVLNEQRFNNSRNGDFGPPSRGFDSERRGERNYDSDRRGDRNYDNDRRGDRFDDRRRDRQFGSSFGTRERLSPTPSFEKEGEREEEFPKERKKLNLKPRTKAPEPEKKDDGSTSSSIFGGAKPVDTTAREREVEEKLAKKEEEIFERKVERVSRDSDNEPEKSHDGSEGRRSRKVSESGSLTRDDHSSETKHVDPPRRTFDDKPSYRRNNFDHRDNRPIRNREYEHDSYRRSDGDGYGFKNRSRVNDGYGSSFSRNRDNYSNDKYDSERNNKSGYGYNNRYSQSNRRDFGSDSDTRSNYPPSRNNNNHQDDNQQKSHHEDDKHLEYKSMNKFDLLANDVQDVDGASN